MCRPELLKIMGVLSIWIQQKGPLKSYNSYGQGPHPVSQGLIRTPDRKARVFPTIHPLRAQFTCHIFFHMTVHIITGQSITKCRSVWQNTWTGKRAKVTEIDRSFE